MPVINTNNAANASLNYLNNNSSAETEKLAQLASGSRIVQASDDAAGLAIGTQLTANATVFQQDQTNIAQGTAILQSADGALAQISNVLQRMMALATEAASGQVTDSQRSQDINTEYAQLQTEIGSIISSTTYAGQTLLTSGTNGAFLGGGSVNFLVGTTSSNILNLSVSAVTLTGFGFVNVQTSAQAMTEIGTVQSAINTITQERAQIGAYESQFNFSAQDIASNVQNIQSAASVVNDADVAQVKASLSANDVKTQASVAALTQAAQLPQELLRLIQS